MKKTILLLAIFIACIGGWYGYHEYNRKNKDLTSSSTDFQLIADSLIREFTMDTALANKKYVNKIIGVKGTIQKIDAVGNPVILFLGSADKISTVKCSMDSTHKDEYQGIKPGNKIAVKGVCTGGEKQDLFGTDVTLNYCVIEKNNNLSN